jgi:hypothetical protein
MRDLAAEVRLGGRGRIFPQKFPVIGVFSLLIDFLGSAFGPGLAENPRNSGVFEPIPGQINREFFSQEQGIRFFRTGNPKRKKRDLRYERRDYAH